jgi:hypothetical protein
MKSPVVTKYLDNLATYDFTAMYYDLLLETEMVKYLVIKTMKESHRPFFEKFVDTVASIDPSKRIFRDGLRFYEQQNLETCHPIDQGYPNLKLYN